MKTAPLQQSRHQRRNRLGVAAALTVAIVLVLASVVLWERDALFGEQADPGTPIPVGPSLTREEIAFYEYIAPRLRAVTAEAAKLAELGRERSRNVIELQRRGERVSDISQQIDDYVASGPVPARFAPGIRRYAVGIVAVRRAIEESRAAFVSFDWDRVARAVEEMEDGADDLAAAVRELEEAAGTAIEARSTATA